MNLGLIAGNGMIIAFVVSITLLPALIRLLNPPSEGQEVGYAFLKPVDHFLETHRLLVIAATLGPVILMSPLLFHVRFDFNPLNLNSDKVESVSTNIVVLDTGDVPAASIAGNLAQQGVRVSALGAHTIRAVTHLDVTRQQCVEAGTVRLVGTSRAAIVAISNTSARWKTISPT